MGRACRLYWTGPNCSQVLVGWSEDMRSFGRSRLNYEVNNKVYPKQME